MDNDLNRQIEDAKTDEQELNQIIKAHDLDAELTREFLEINKAFTQLEIKYQSLLNARKFLNGSH